MAKMGHTIYDHTPDTGIFVAYPNSNFEIEWVLGQILCLSHTDTQSTCKDIIIGPGIVNMQCNDGEFKSYTGI